MTCSPSKIGLVLQGGGARGAYQIGVLKAVAEIWGQKPSPFPIVTGASVGAINAAQVAAASTDFQRGMARLEKLWRGLTCDAIYETSPSAIAASSARWLWSIVAGGLGWGDPCSLLDNRPLGKLLDSTFRPNRISRAIQLGALDALCITASSYGDGSAITFLESRGGIEDWSRVRRKSLRTRIESEHLMASSALPYVFPAIRVGDRYFGDGALRLTAPLSPAIRCGAEKLLVIGARDNHPGGSGGSGTETYPSIGDMSGHALDIMFNDNLESDCERLERVNRTVKLLTPEAREKTRLRQIEFRSLQPSQDLRDIAADHRSEMPRTIQLLLKSLGAWGEDARLISYLLFEPGFIGALIDLAYDDTMARSNEIADFLKPDSTSSS